MAALRLESSDGSFVVWNMSDERADEVDYELRVLLGEPTLINPLLS